MCLVGDAVLQLELHQRKDLEGHGGVDERLGAVNTLVSSVFDTFDFYMLYIYTKLRNQNLESYFCIFSTFLFPFLILFQQILKGGGG